MNSFSVQVKASNFSEYASMPAYVTVIVCEGISKAKGAPSACAQKMMSYFLPFGSEKFTVVWRFWKVADPERSTSWFASSEA